jgi:ribosomal protein S18 acetylase RimI-like enzyme
MLTLTICHTLACSKYWIEDVVVDPAHRGEGVGRALVRAAVNHVKENETVPAIYLTSNPSRVAARSLYMSEGFEEYNTGVFRLTQK